MDDAKNFMLSMMNTVKERIGNPFVGAFATAWLIWNFKIILVVLGKGDGGWQAKIQYIFVELMPARSDWIVHGYLIPAAAACIWIFLLPPILRIIACWHEEQLNKTRKKLYDASEKRVLSKDEEIALRSHIVEERLKIVAERESIFKSLEDSVRKEGELTSDLKDAKDKIKHLTTESESFENKISDYKTEVEKLNQSINPPELFIDEDNLLDQSYINNILSEVGFILYKNNESISNFVFQKNPAVMFPVLVSRPISFNGVRIFEKHQIIEESYACILLLIYNEYFLNRKNNNGDILLTRSEFSKIIPLGFRYSYDEVKSKLFFYNYISMFRALNKDDIAINIKANQAGKFFQKTGFNLKLPKS